MAKKGRPELKKGDYALLINEVDSLCPLCSEQLIFFKDAKSSNLGQAAHIYPHSPTDTEAELLANAPRLSENVDHISNLIMLCPTCHTKFDHPRTFDEYMMLYSLKKNLITRQKAREYYRNHDIESEICDVFRLLESALKTSSKVELSYELRDVNAKLAGCTSCLPEIIKRDIYEYYSSIKTILFEVEKENPGISESFAMSVKSLSSQYMRIDIPKDQIYDSLIEWLNKKTGNKYYLVIPFLVAFYIQNCEVF